MDGTVPVKWTSLPRAPFATERTGSSVPISIARQSNILTALAHDMIVQYIEIAVMANM